jgi:integrase/recombinase XerC/integrase/recombinase XerD
MDESGRALELVKLLNMEEGEVNGERMERWGQAFEDWMEERRTRFSQKVAKRSHLAWREFLASTRKAPWEVGVEDVEGHIAELEKRGLRPGTILDRLAGLSKFYEHCQKKGIDPVCEAGFNPASQARRPKVVQYEKANYLSRAEEAALLEAIRQDPSPMGKRDYALILMLLRTGRRAGEVRELRWGELGSGSGERCLGEGIGDKGATERAPRDRGAGKEGIGDKGGGLPGEVRQAVREYLEATGRWEGIRPEEYVFAPSEAALVRESRERAEDWAGSRPLSTDELHYLVKLHAGRAGLKAKRITCHTLRHTAAMRRAESGETVEAIGAFLRMERYHTTTYLKKLETQPKERLRARKRASSVEETPSRGPCRTKPRNHLALEHGLTAKYLPEFEWLAEQGVQLQEIDWVILRYRVVMRRAMLVGNEVRTLEEAIRILKVMGIAACRLVKAIKLKERKFVG